MAGNSNSFLPISRPSDYTPLADGSQASNTPAAQPLRKSKKMLAGILAGLFLFVFFGAIVDYDKQKVSNETCFPLDEDDMASEIYEDTVTPQVLKSPLSRGPSAGVSEKTSRNFLRNGGLKEFSWNNSMLSWQRTAFHFQPEKNWMNGTLSSLQFSRAHFFFLNFLFIHLHQTKRGMNHDFRSRGNENSKQPFWN